jgi:hypothetical protein
METPKVGRPTKCTPKRVAIIEEAIRDKHSSRHAAAAFAGITYDCLLDWEDRGQTGEEPFASFFHRLAQAEAEAEVDVLDRLLNSKLTDGAKFWLERRFPDRYGNRGKQTHEVTGAAGGPVQVENSGPSVLAIVADPEASALASALVARLSEGTPLEPDHEPEAVDEGAA